MAKGVVLGPGLGTTLAFEIKLRLPNERADEKGDCNEH
jgi:hypothetical protein